MNYSNCLQCKRPFYPQSFEVDYGFDRKKAHYTKYCVKCSNKAVDKAKEFIKNYSIIFDEKSEKYVVLAKSYNLETVGAAYEG